MDNRLDFITNIDSDFIEEMTDIRKEFIKLDHKLQEYGDHENVQESGAGRTLALARTNLEIALQFTIKSLCLLGEVK